jgi:hypothetical protein
MVLAGLRGDRSAREVCREYQIAETLITSGVSGCWTAARPRWRTRGRRPRSGLRWTGSSAGSASSSGPLAARPTSWMWRGTLAGLGVRVRVARSRAVVAGSYRPAVVARVAGVSRQALYRRPSRRPVQAGPGRPAGDDAVIVETAKAKCDRRHPHGRRAGQLRARPAGQPQTRPAGHARPPAAAAVTVWGSPAPARVLLRYPPGCVVALGHDQGLDRPARLGLPTRHHRLLHPRAGRQVAGVALPR